MYDEHADLELVIPSVPKGLEFMISFISYLLNVDSSRFSRMEIELKR